MSESISSETHEGTYTAPAYIVLFGYPGTSGEVTLRPRPRAWRVGGAVRYGIAGLVAAPLVGLVPPHAPWAVGALVGGIVLARRRYKERFTLEAVQGRCPRCGGRLGARPGRLRSPHPIACEACHHECTLTVRLDEDPTEPTPHT